jgi:hypothetical protein
MGVQFPFRPSGPSCYFDKTEDRGERELQVMSIHHLALCLLTVGGLVFSGCASDSTTTTQTDQTTKRVHTQEELRKSGQSETGPALERTDPAVRMSGGR